MEQYNVNFFQRPDGSPYCVFVCSIEKPLPFLINLDLTHTTINESPMPRWDAVKFGKAFAEQNKTPMFF